MKSSDGGYFIKSKLGTFIDVSSNKIAENENVYLYSYSGDNKQKWILKEEKVIYSDKPDESYYDNIKSLFGTKNIIRYAGKDRYKTSILAAQALQKSLSKDKFDKIIVACGTDYPDALTGTYLANKNQAPILLVDKSYEREVKNYIKENLVKNGTVYILGGTGVVSSSFEKELKKISNVKRLYGADRYETNLSILNECGIRNEELLICSGNGFADSLSVSSSGKPILLVDKQLDGNQKKYMSSSNIKQIYLIGGIGVVNKTVEAECKNYSDTVRLAGVDRYNTSVAVSRAFFGSWSECQVLAYGQDYPDGLSGGAIAASLQAPVVLIDNNNYEVATFFSRDIGLKKAVVLGGPTLIKNDIVENMIS